MHPYLTLNGMVRVGCTPDGDFVLRCIEVTQIILDMQATSAKFVEIMLDMKSEELLTCPFLNTL
jgi:hypothetical protein